MEEMKKCKCCGRELPLSMYSKNPSGYIGICRDCNHEHRRKGALKREKERKMKQAIEQGKTLGLDQFTPRQLMMELARRGYRGKLQFVQEIDITNF